VANRCNMNYSGFPFRNIRVQLKVQTEPGILFRFTSALGSRCLDLLVSDSAKEPAPPLTCRVSKEEHLWIFSNRDEESIRIELSPEELAALEERRRAESEADTARQNLAKKLGIDPIVLKKNK